MANIILGSILLLVGILLIFKKKKKLKSFQKTFGTIIEINRKRVHKPNGYISNTNIPVVEFQLNNKNIKFENQVGGTNYTKTGVKVNVFYDPKNPEKAYINNFWSLWLMEFVFSFIGLLFLLSGIVLVLE